MIANATEYLYNAGKYDKKGEYIGKYEGSSEITSLVTISPVLDAEMPYTLHVTNQILKALKGGDPTKPNLNSAEPIEDAVTFETLVDTFLLNTTS